MAIRSTYQSKPKKLREMAGKNLPTVVVRSNTFGQIGEALDQLLKQAAGGAAITPLEDEVPAMDEVLAAIDTVIQTGKAFELTPQPAQVRRRQLQITESRKMFAETIGEEPNRRVRITPARLM